MPKEILLNKNETKLRIVIVDDQSTVRKAIRRVLEGMSSFLLEEVPSGKDAIKYLKQHHADLIILDIYMPKGDGFEVLEYLRGRSVANDIPVIFVTGEVSKQDIVRAGSLKVTDYIIKPFEVTDLINKVKTILEKYSNPSEKAVMIRQAESELLNKNYSSAKEILLKLNSENTKSPRILVGLAEAERGLNNSTAALPLLMEAIRINPLYFPAFAVAADISIENGQRDKAVEFLNEELKIHGRQPQRRLLLAELYAQNHDFDHSFAETRQALVDSSSSASEEILLKMANLQKRAGNVDRAIRYCLRAYRNNPRCLEAMRSIADICLENKEPLKAVHTLTDVYNAKPNQWEALIARAEVHNQLGNIEKSLEDLDIILNKVPDHVEAIETRVEILAGIPEQLTQALIYCEQLVKLRGQDKDYGLLGLIYVRSGRHKDAATAYQKATEMCPDNPKYFYNLGVTYEKLKNYDKAISCFKRVVELLPGGHNEAKQAIDRLQKQLSQ